MKPPKLYKRKCRQIPKPRRFLITICGSVGPETITVTNSWVKKYAMNPEAMGAYRHGRK